ncbi:aspartate 4-decarboxylase [Alistipes sp. OttesenSCG-928-B03]|nr:aspartate 4-decarboxylase [Alistipes sp. OttesenSCG-928-B03]
MNKSPKLEKSHENGLHPEQPSPFEQKSRLLKLADARHQHDQRSLLNAGRGNPNWTAIAPREAFVALQAFAISECRLDMEDPSGLCGVPQKPGISKRFYKYLQQEAGRPGIDLLTEIFRKGVQFFSPEVDDLVFEFVEGAIGCQYPEPVRMLHYCERVVRAFLLQELCDGKPPLSEDYDLFATEGGTAAVCYIFDALVENCLLKKGDHIAIGVPAFIPYLDIPHLSRFDFEVTYVYASEVDADGNPTFQYPDNEIDKLGDTKIKAFFVINPSNPTSVQMCERSRSHLVEVVKKRNPNLMIFTDDVYGTFVDGFVSLLNDLPRNTLCIYSFSKHFGATGWRLGVVALHNNNVYDDMLAEIPQAEKDRLETLYEHLSLKPGKLKFIDRLAANSRDVALNHTAGLSAPQQVMMALFAGASYVDMIQTGSAYKKATNALIHKRYNLFWEGMGIPVRHDPNRADYYCTFDVRDWAVKTHGEEFFAWMEANFEPVDIVHRLAEECAIVLLNGNNIADPEWSVRISLATLEDHEYRTIGRLLKSVLNGYAKAWKAQ